MTPKARYFWPLLFVLFLTDCATKDLAVEHLDRLRVRIRLQTHSCD